MAIDIERDAEHRFTLDQYHRLIEGGAFDGSPRAELIDGWLVPMSPRSFEHENLVEWFSRWAITGTDPAIHRVRVTGSLTFKTSEPEPDVSVIPADAPQPYHPSHAVLIVEVSVSSLRHDLILKARVYADAGITEYWVVDIEGERVVVHRDPVDGIYRDVADHRDGEIAPESIELPALDVPELFRIAHRR